MVFLILEIQLKLRYFLFVGLLDIVDVTCEFLVPLNHWLVLGLDRTNFRLQLFSSFLVQFNWLVFLLHLLVKVLKSVIELVFVIFSI